MSARSHPFARPAAAIPHSFECARCGTIHNSPDAAIPPGWSQCGALIRCNDCTPTHAAPRGTRRAA